MTTGNISMPGEVEAFIEAQRAREGLAFDGEPLRALIRDARKWRAEQAPEVKLREASEGGPATPTSPRDWAALRREVVDGRAGEMIRPRFA